MDRRSSINATHSASKATLRRKKIRRHYLLHRARLLYVEIPRVDTWVSSRISSTPPAPMPRPLARAGPCCSTCGGIVLRASVRSVKPSRGRIRREQRIGTTPVAWSRCAVCAAMIRYRWLPRTDDEDQRSTRDTDPRSTAAHRRISIECERARRSHHGPRRCGGTLSGVVVDNFARVDSLLLSSLDDSVQPTTAQSQSPQRTAADARLHRDRRRRTA
jgi:hypothetical protein